MAKGGGYRGGYGNRGTGMSQSNMMKQAQKMQQDMMKMQEELDTAEYTATAGGGAVKATVSGKLEFTSLVIDPEALDPEEADILQDMILAAVNEAIRSAEKARTENMSKLTGGFNLSGLGL